MTTNPFTDWYFDQTYSSFLSLFGKSMSDIESKSLPEGNIWRSELNHWAFTPGFDHFSWFQSVPKIPSNCLWIQVFGLLKYKNRIQLFFWSNHLVSGSLKIEVCQIEIENTSSEILVLEYQDWFQKLRSDTDDLVSTWVRQVGIPRGMPLNYRPNYIYLYLFEMNKSVSRIRSLFSKMEIRPSIGFELKLSLVIWGERWFKIFLSEKFSYDSQTFLRLYLDKQAWGQYQSI